MRAVMPTDTVCGFGKPRSGEEGDTMNDRQDICRQTTAAGIFKP
jgi:hypothetical protein